VPVLAKKLSAAGIFVVVPFLKSLKVWPVMEETIIF
jgi:hypothetical protein